MAFEYGLLGRAREGTPRDALDQLLEVIGSDVDATLTEVTEGEGWASATLKFPDLDSGAVEETIQVSVGGPILEMYLRQARGALSDGELEDRNLMVTVSVVGPMNPVVSDRIVSYAQDRWDGIPWDEVSGFATSFER